MLRLAKRALRGKAPLHGRQVSTFATPSCVPIAHRLRAVPLVDVSEIFLAHANKLPTLA